MKYTARIVWQEHARTLLVLLAIMVAAGIAVFIAVPVPGHEERKMGLITDIGPLNAGETSLNQRAVVVAGGQSFMVDVANYPTCRVGSRVTVHQRSTLIGVTTSLWPEGCR